MRRGVDEAVDVRLIGGPAELDAVTRVLDEAFAGGGDGRRYAAASGGERRYRRYVVDAASVSSSPVEAAERAKRARDLPGEVAALVAGEESLRSAPWYPVRAGDVVAVDCGDGGAVYEVADSDEGEVLRLLSSDPGCGGVCVDTMPGDPLFELWFEAGPDRLTVLRGGRVVHPNR